jgi:hypothetical protein
MNERESKVTRLNSSNRVARNDESQVKATAEASASSEITAISQLSPEEQMALYEKELKENDWGHQPC